MSAGMRWPTDRLSYDLGRPIDGVVRAIMWPTYTLVGRERWFDELYVWTERVEATTMQRARIQLTALEQAFAMLEGEHVRKIGVTLSFGTVERALDLVSGLFHSHRLMSHRMLVLLRGDLERMRSRYRVRGFVDYLRAQHVPVGYRIDAPRVSMELRTFDFLAPDFVKVAAPESPRLEFWRDVALEARVGGVTVDWLVIAGIETLGQKKMAADSGFRFGQGHAMRAPYDPPMPLPSGSNPPATLTDSVLPLARLAH